MRLRIDIGRTRRTLLAAPLLFALFAAAPVMAGEINDIDGPAIGGYDPVAYFKDGKPVAGLPSLTADYKSATFRFASIANRDAFMAQPERFAPRYGGFCAYAASRGYKAVTDPAAYAIVSGKLYLNYSPSVLRTWNQDRAGYIVKGDKNWPEVAKQDAVTR